MSDTNEGGVAVEQSTPKGAFVESLLRNNSKIRKDRARAILENAEVMYRREIEDLNTEINNIKRERDNMIDLSPTSADSLVLASEFDAKAFSAKDIKLSVDIRNKEIKLDIAKERYKNLFGREITLTNYNTTDF